MKAALLYLILFAGLGGSLYLFFTSREAGGEDMTLIGLGGAVVSLALLLLLFIVRKFSSRRGKRDEGRTVKAR
jgi:hypothetical protein